jgi:hypothetical protein
MSYDRLKTSERNRIIADFTAGKPDPNYDVIPSKSQKGKYTIRRKLPAENKKTVEEKPTEETKAEPSAEDIPNTADMEAEEELNDEAYNQYLDDAYYTPKTKLTKNAMFREMQLMLNKIMLEQMKMLRRDQKRTEAKRKKYGTKTKKIHNILAGIAFNDDQIKQPPPPKDADEVEKFYQRQQEEEENPELPERFYKEEEPNPDEQPYDEQLNEMAAEPQIPSRRDKLKAFI